MPTNSELFNSNNVKVGHLCWNYRGCWHQTGPQVDAHCIPWVLIHSTSPDQSNRIQVALLVAASPMHTDIEQFARLLPTLVVVAVFQAPSPESNPHSALPVIATVVPGTAIRG